MFFRFSLCSCGVKHTPNWPTLISNIQKTGQSPLMLYIIHRSFRFFYNWHDLFAPYLGRNFVYIWLFFWSSPTFQSCRHVTHCIKLKKYFRWILKAIRHHILDPNLDKISWLQGIGIFLSKMTHTKTVHLEVLEDLVQFREILEYDKKPKYFQFQAQILVAITSLYPMKISNKMMIQKFLYITAL